MATKTKKTKKQKKTLNRHDRVVIAWQAPEYIQHHRGKRWYIAALIIVILIAAVSIITDNLTLALAILAFAGVYYYLQTHHPPKNIEIRLTEMGIYVGDRFFPYSNIKSFWIIYHDGVKTLNLRITRHYHSDIIIQFDGQDPVAVRQYLVGQIPEWEGKEESLSDIFIRLLKL